MRFTFLNDDIIINVLIGLALTLTLTLSWESLKLFIDLIQNY